jgi:hypothetical protein
VQVDLDNLDRVFFGEGVCRRSLVGSYSVCGEPGLRIDRLVDIAVLNTSWIQLEMQVGTKGTTGLADVSDDLPGANALTGLYRHGRHVRRHGRLAIRVIDGDMVAGPVTGVAGIEHDSSLDGTNWCAMSGSEVDSGVVARPTAVLTKVSANNGSRNRCRAASAAGSSTAGPGSTRAATAGTIATALVGGAAARLPPAVGVSFV